MSLRCTVVDRVADDERQQHAEDVVGDDRQTAPGEVLPVALQVREEGTDLMHGQGTVRVER